MDTDIVILGSGVSGIQSALKCSAFADVVILTKDKMTESNTFYAQGGLAAVFGKDDSKEQHVLDTLRAGDGISNKKIASLIANGSPYAVMELSKIGVNFNKNNDGKFKLSREAVHSRARIVHSSDMTGREIEMSISKAARNNKRIKIMEHHMVLDLITKNNKCFGCIVLDLQNKRIFPIFARKTVIATGGIGQVYKITTNPAVATGDGIAIALRQDVILEDMEFMQFHPTMMHNSNPSFLISETLRGEGGLLKNSSGKTYMGKYHRDGELAPRDVVSRFSVIEMKKTRSKNVYLDMTNLDSSYLKKRFPNIYNECLRYGIDMSKDSIPVSPAAHYICGGIKTDSYGKTSMENLYAVGECACTQLHGADRLASNSMTEGLVIASRMSKIIRNRIKKAKLEKVEVVIPILSAAGNGRISALRASFRNIMWEDVGIIKSRKSLMRAMKKMMRIEEKIEKIKKDGTNKDVQELDNMITVAKTIIVASLRRKESRGTHFMEDYPERHDSIWRVHLTIDKRYLESKWKN